MVGLTAPRIVYGIHSISPYSITDGTFYGILKVLGNGTFAMTGESIELRGGSSKFPWAVEAGNVTAELTLSMKEYPNFIFELFMGKAPTAIVAAATGETRSFVNTKGTSVKSASNGLDTITVTSGDHADLKFGTYVIKATDTAKFDVYLSTDADITRGTDGSYQDDLLKITAAPLDIASTPAVDATFGLTFTKAGTPAFVVGDTATFKVLPPHSGGMEVVVGGLSDSFVSFGAILMTQKRSNGELFEIDVFDLVGAGGNLGANEKAFSETSLTAKASFNSAKGGIAKIVAVKPA